MPQAVPDQDMSLDCSAVQGSSIIPHSSGCTTSAFSSSMLVHTRSLHLQMHMSVTSSMHQSNMAKSVHYLGNPACAVAKSLENILLMALASSPSHKLG